MTSKGVLTLAKNNLRFYSAHFLAKLNDKGEVIRETLHGHNYRVVIEVKGHV